MTQPSEPITIQVNGEPYNCDAAIALPDLLAHLNFNARLVAVEYNGEIVHRQFWAKTLMKPGDRLEIVTIVGGG